ncbi:hypothetical protein AB9P05_19905 [Roseivirga sp. BDSF3-8]|uniref:hypothetical protein n=1 Tax=Roseivirga sp. BDSF3-8 TaxID=3241598 RepID=UPI00353243DE
MKGFVSAGIERVFPPFNAYKADTEANKARFEDFLLVPVSEDVNNIYCFDDAIGIDTGYLFAFNCSRATAEKIIERLALRSDTVYFDHPYKVIYEFEWWDEERVGNLSEYNWSDGQSYRFYWYDEENQKSYYYTFSM